jgi:hypothetical protein
MKGKTLLRLSLLPVALGAVAAGLLSTGWIPDPFLILHVAGDVAGLALTAGVLLSLLVGAVSLCAWLWDRRWQRRLAAARADRADERRLFLQRLDHEIKNPLLAGDVDRPPIDVDPWTIGTGGPTIQSGRNGASTVAASKSRRPAPPRAPRPVRPRQRVEAPAPRASPGRRLESLLPKQPRPAQPGEGGIPGPIML